LGKKTSVIITNGYENTQETHMARKKTSSFEDLIEIASKLPWKVGVLLALVSYLGFHYLATQPSPSFVATDLKSYGHTIGGNVGRQLMITMSGFLQYIVAIAFLIGASVSFYKRRRQSELHFQVAKAPSRNALESISWREFEGLTAEVFRRKGFEVVERGGNGPDGGVDLELKIGTDKYLVQCKQWKVTKVGVTTVRELYGVMAAEGAVGGFVVASGDFTEEAKRFVEGRSIELVPTNSLLRLVKNTEGSATSSALPGAKPFCPKCGSPMARRTARRGENKGESFWGCSQFPACRGIRAER
jgi:restriction system protein